MQVQLLQSPEHFGQCGMHLHDLGLFNVGAFIVIRLFGPFHPPVISLWVNGTCGAFTVLGSA